MSKKIIFGVVGGLFTLVVVAALAVPFFIDQEKIKPTILEKIKSATGYTVEWEGNVGISVLPVPNASLNKVVVKADDTTVFNADEVDVSLALMPLLSGNVDIKGVTLTRPDIKLVVDESGRQTWVVAKNDAPEVKAAEAKSDEGAEAAKSQPIKLSSFKIVDGHFSYADRVKKSETVIEDINTVIDVESFQGPFNIKGSLKANHQALELDANIGAIPEPFKDLPVQLKIRLPEQGADIEYTGMLVTKDPLLLDGSLMVEAKDIAKTVRSFGVEDFELPPGFDADGHIKATLKYTPQFITLDNLVAGVMPVALNGSVKLSGLDATPVVNVDIATAPIKGSDKLPDWVAFLDKAALKGDLSYADNTLSIGKAVLKMRDAAADISGKVAMRDGQKPLLDLSVSSGSPINLDAMLANLSGKAPVKTPEGQKVEVESKKSNSATAVGFALPFEGALNLNLTSLTYQGKTYAPLKADISGKGNGLSLMSLNIGLPAQTNLSASGSVADTTALSGIDVKFDLSTADIHKLAEAYQQKLPEGLNAISAMKAGGAVKGSREAMDAKINTSVEGLNLSIAGKVADPMGELAISALSVAAKDSRTDHALSLIQPSLKNKDSLRGALDINLKLSKTGDEIAVPEIKGMFAGIALNGALKINAPAGGKPDIAGQLNLGDVVLAPPSSASSASTASAPSSGNAKSAPSSGGGAVWSREAIDTSFLYAADADLKITAKSVTYDQWNLNNANLNFTLNGGNLKLPELSASMFGGSAFISGSMTGGKTAQDAMAFDFDVDAKNIDAKKLYSAFKGRNETMINGTINTAQFNVASSGVSPAALVYALKGKGSMNGKNLVVDGIDLVGIADTMTDSLKPLDRAAGLLGATSAAGGKTAFETFVSDFTMTNGVISFNPMYFDGSKGRIDVTGTVDLPRWYTNLLAKVSIKGRDVEPFDIEIKGSLDNPAKSTAQNLLNKYLEKRATKLLDKKLNKLLGDKLGGNVVQPEAPADGAAAPAASEGSAAEQPADPIGNILKDPKNIKPEDAAGALKNLFGR